MMKNGVKSVQVTEVKAQKTCNKNVFTIVFFRNSNFPKSQSETCKVTATECYSYILDNIGEQSTI